MRIEPGGREPVATLLDPDGPVGSGASLSEQDS